MKPSLLRSLRVLLLVVSAFCVPLSAFPLTITNTWDVLVPGPGIQRQNAPQGDSRVFAPRFLQFGRIIDMTDCSADYLYQTNGMTTWWQIEATCDATTGRILIPWGPANDAGATRYSGWIRLKGPTTTNYLAQLDIYMFTTPGFLPNALAIPVEILDFAQVSVSNAPWATPEDLTNIFLTIPTVYTDTVARASAATATSNAAAAQSTADASATTGGLALAAAQAAQTTANAASTTGGLALAAAQAIEVQCSGGYVVTNWFEPVLTPYYRALASPSYEITNQYLVYTVRETESGLIDYGLDYDAQSGYPGDVSWSVDNTNNAVVQTNMLVSVTPGKTVLLAASGGGISRTLVVPINYARIGEQITELSHLLPGSAAETATLPLLIMASNYLATTSEPLVHRPTEWNTNEVWRTNYAAVAHWLPTPTWNANCWLTNAPQVFCSTAIATGTLPSAAPYWHGTLITPRIILGAKHVGVNVGSTKWWLTPEGVLTNAVVSRQISPFVSGAAGGFADIILGVLDRAMPSNMVARVATLAQMEAAFPGDEPLRFSPYVAGVAFNQHLDASLIEFSSPGASRRPRLPQALSLSELHHRPHPGDSGRPAFIVWGNQAVLQSVYWTAAGGSSVSINLAVIEAAVAAEGESLTYVDFEVAP